MNTIYSQKPPRLNRGLLIVFEGLNVSGITTQIQKLKNALRFCDQRVEVFEFPNLYTDSGKKIKNVLDGKIIMDKKELYSLFVENRTELLEEIEFRLDSGIHVICDRWIFSGVAYSVA